MVRIAEDNLRAAGRLAAAVMALLLATAGHGQTVEDLARKLAEPSDARPASEPPSECPIRLPDGTCPDEPETRQLVVSSSPAARSRSAASPVRSEIQVGFLLGSAELTAQAKATLDRFARALAEVGSYRPFVIEGHTDNLGSRESNLVLSRERAKAVADYLAAKGVNKDRLTSRGYGFDRPLPGRSASDPANRRVEVASTR